MNWKTIRLELGPTEDFPKGSASRAFLLRAPIDASGEIDAEALARDPAQATVRRFWASERDESGRLERSDGAWVFRPRVGQDGQAYIFSGGPFRGDARIIIRQPDGSDLPFRVVSISRFGANIPATA
jgi:hypothetical protein